MGRKFTIPALFYFVFEGKFQVQASPGGGGAYIRRGDLTEGFLRYDFGGLIFGGAYTWRGFFSELYGNYNREYFMESAGVRYLRRSGFCIKNRTSKISDTKTTSA